MLSRNPLSFKSIYTILVFFTIGILFIGIAFWWYVMPNIRENDRLEQEISAIEEWEQINGVLIKKEVPEPITKEQLVRLNEMVPVEREVSRYLYDIYQIFNRLNLDFERIKIEEELPSNPSLSNDVKIQAGNGVINQSTNGVKNQDAIGSNKQTSDNNENNLPYKKIIFSMTIVGDYQIMQQVTEELWKLPRVVKFNEIRYSFSKQPNMYEINYVFEIYYYVEPFNNGLETKSLNIRIPNRKPINVVPSYW
ncbi:hypothetical protein L1765_01675 [Microaerobacter geothermalis]|uniref:hypothetical protein n=1 Tax=Microaerobacter geothermalis TaxID=674972 RepID=UPI001F36AD61|nr:hypothetical protein [Microaerobacter geothermalis]MCF6092702.1 hypothetical protein [Microaerobacter geothermalis]